MNFLYSFALTPVQLSKGIFLVDISGERVGGGKTEIYYEFKLPPDIQQPLPLQPLAKFYHTIWYI